MPAALSPREALRPLAWTRAALGVVFLLRTTPLLSLFDPAFGDASPLLGWPGPGQRAAAFGWVLSAGAIKALCALRTLGALGFALGLFPLAAGLTAGVCGYIVLLQDVYGFTFTQHLLFLGTAVVALTDCAAVAAVRPEPPRAPRSSLWLCHGFCVSVYFWASVVKTRRDWYDGRTLGVFYGDGRLHGALADLLLSTPTRRAFMGPLVALTELSLVPLLLIPRTRWLGLAMAAGLHISIEMMARPDVIGWGMLALLLSFVPTPAAQGRRRRKGAAPA